MTRRKRVCIFSLHFSPNTFDLGLVESLDTEFVGCEVWVVAVCTGDISHQPGMAYTPTVVREGILWSRFSSALRTVGPEVGCLGSPLQKSRQVVGAAKAGEGHRGMDQEAV